MNTQAQVECQCIGIDLGATSNKIALLTATPFLIELGAHTQILICGRSQHLHTYSNSHYQPFKSFLETAKGKIEGKPKIVVTGGGGINKLADIAKIFESQLQQLVEFDANAKGLQFYRYAGLPILAETFKRKKGGDVKVTSRITTLQEYSQSFIFFSLGSGCNWQIFGDGLKGIQRKKKELKGGDQYILEGTNLGAGFLMGLGRLLTSENDYSLIAARLKGDENLRQYYDAFWVNLAQFSINICLAHKQKYVLLSGTLLAYTEDIATLYSRALKAVHLSQDYETTILRIQKLQGFVGALGALQKALRS